MAYDSKILKTAGSEYLGRQNITELCQNNNTIHQMRSIDEKGHK